MCVADSHNDISMISNADIGVAVTNTGVKVQVTAKLIVADNNRNGVAKVIKNVLT